jgi:hypothetical protein
MIERIADRESVRRRQCDDVCGRQPSQTCALLLAGFAGLGFAGYRKLRSGRPAFFG